MLIESQQFAQERIYHKQKLVLVWSAMRHFADELKDAGWPVTYAIATALRDWIKAESITELRLMDPVDHPFRQWVEELELPCQLTLLDNNLLLWSTNDFNTWANQRKRSGTRRTSSRSCVL